MVFQNYALYPHMTVAGIMSFGLKLRKFPKAEIRQRVDNAARILNITELLTPPQTTFRWPAPARRHGPCHRAKSQGISVRRAAIQSGRKLRVQMRTEIKRIHQKVKTTTVYVTHDQVEAMTLADWVVVMHSGKIEQIGTPNDLYHHPKTRFVAGFIVRQR